MNATTRSRPTRLLLALMAAVMLLTVITPPAPADAHMVRYGEYDSSWKAGEVHRVVLNGTFSWYGTATIKVKVHCRGESSFSVRLKEQYPFRIWKQRGYAKHIKCGETAIWRNVRNTWAYDGVYRADVKRVTRGSIPASAIAWGNQGPLKPRWGSPPGARN